MNKKIPDKVINRLTLYHCILFDFINNKEDFISSKQIAQLLNTDDSQVRKDLNYLDNSGKSRVGYAVKELKLAIEKTLGFKKTKKAFIIGAGNLGTAIANYGNFSDYGLNILSLFDNQNHNFTSTIPLTELTQKIFSARSISDLYRIFSSHLPLSRSFCL